MLAIIRFLAKLIKKEQLVLSRYEKSHPHFMWYLGLDAVLSVVLAFGVFQIATSHSLIRLDAIMGHSGLVTMSASEFIDHVKEDNLDAYWLGPVSEYKYTINHQAPGIADIFYLPKASGQSDTKLFLYEVKTYKNKEVWEARTHPLLATSGTTTITTAQGLSIKINPASMKGEVVTFSDRPEIVAIAYPAPQSQQAMIKNAESLQPVR
ncbi:MAG TPA: hypothetical protein VMW30_04770 [Candidatus Paceibacterota bacterium]|nr:hypothetical protein [Candidatus Paceibacterota bacterium]